MRALQRNTFGDSKAAMVLAERLSVLDKRSLTAKVGRLLSFFNLTLKQLPKLDNKIFIQVSKLVYDDVILKADDLPKEVSSYVKNILSAKYKAWCVKNNIQLKTENRITNH